MKAEDWVSHVLWPIEGASMSPNDSCFVTSPNVSASFPLTIALIMLASDILAMHSVLSISLSSSSFEVFWWERTMNTNTSLASIQNCKVSDLTIPTGHLIRIRFFFTDNTNNTKISYMKRRSKQFLAIYLQCEWQIYKYYCLEYPWDL